VAHNEFQKIDMLEHKAKGAIIYDVKGILPKEIVDARL
jgi:UDP-N-acetyl-D-mannosaminuronate dehydrogenase